MPDACFQIKGSAVTTIVLELFHYSTALFAEQLKEKVAQAPKLFDRAPVVISLEKLDNKQSSINFSEVLSTCTKAGLQPLAFKGDADRFSANIKNTGLALLSLNAARTTNSAELGSGDQRDIQDQEASVTHSTPTVETPLPTKFITQPVRSGQQVYAQGTDLIVMSQVSEGAEVIADGHIHIYGALRGRALAGVRGNNEARIFCRVMEAELLSINGDFILSDDLRSRKEVWKKPTQVYHDAGTLRVEPI